MYKTNTIAVNDDIAKYEKDTGKQWTDTEIHMVEICLFYGYGYNWNNKGNIVISNSIYGDSNYKDAYKFLGKNIEEIDSIYRHYEYKNAAEMVEEWKDICRETNRDYKENNMDQPFDWVD